MKETISETNEELHDFHYFKEKLKHNLRKNQLQMLPDNLPHRLKVLKKYRNLKSENIKWLHQQKLNSWANISLKPQKEIEANSLPGTLMKKWINTYVQFKNKLQIKCISIQTVLSLFPCTTEEYMWDEKWKGVCQRTPCARRPQKVSVLLLRDGMKWHNFTP